MKRKHKSDTRIHQIEEKGTGLYDLNTPTGNIVIGTFKVKQCDEFTRKLKGALVCKGWWWQPALDCWFQVDGGHSELITVLLDENNKKQVYLIEGQKEFDMFELAAEIFGEHKPYLIKQ